MDILLGFMVLVLTVGLWCLYHKMFKIFYFGNPFNAILSELLSAFFTAFMLVAIAGELLQKVFSFILVILPYALGLFVILGIVQFVKKINTSKSTTSPASDKEES